MHRLLLSAVIAAVAASPIAPTRAETPAQACSRVDADDTPRPIPASLVPAVNTLFNSSMPTRMARDTTVYRCADGHVLVCTTGANLPCGKANTARTNTGADAWCQDNPNATFVPAVASGHDTIYRWRCRNGSADIERQESTVDRHGFITEFWKRLH